MKRVRHLTRACTAPPAANPSTGELSMTRIIWITRGQHGQ